MIHNLVFWGLCALLVFLPLPFGSTDEWAVCVFQVAVLALFGLHVFGGKAGEEAAGGISKEVESRRGGEVAGGKRGEKDAGRGRAGLSLVFKVPLAVFFAVSVLQIIPFPPAVVRALSPRAFAIAGADGPAGWRTLSLAPAVTGYELLGYAVYFLFGVLVFKHVRTRKETKVFVLVLLATAVFESFYGLLELFGGTERIFGYVRDYHLGSATGTFINRDHFSGFLEMIFPLSLGYLLARTDFFSFKQGLGLKEKILWFSQERLQKALIFGLVSVVIGLGIIFSRSRTGILIFFATIFLMLIALSAAGRGRTAGSGGGGGKGGERFAGVLRTVSLFIVFSAALIGLRPIIERFSWENLKKEERPVFYRNTLSLIKSFPLVGTGPGSFVDVYPMFDKKASFGLLDHAHNDYLEILAESGVIAGGGMILLAVGTWIFLFARWLKRRDNFDRGVVLGCVLGIAALLIHSLTDFNLRIPSNAAYFVMLFALALRKTLDYGNEKD